MKVKFEIWNDPVYGESEVACITVSCPFCGKETEIVVDKDKYDTWQGGMLIQRAFPNLDSEQRELLITGMCYECQASFFKD